MDDFRRVLCMTTPATFAARDRGRHELAELVRGNPDQAEVLDAAVALLQRIVGFEAVFAAATDPATTLFAGAGIVSGLPTEDCGPWLDNEFAGDDFLKFLDLHRSGEGPATLHRETRGRPGRSSRYREILVRRGLGPELRSTLEIGGECWGALALMRSDGTADFDDADLAAVDAVADVVARGLRAAVLRETAADAGSGLGVIVLDRTGNVVSMSDAARSLCLQLRQPGVVVGDRVLPGEIHIAAVRARARALGDGGPEPVLRLRGHAGVWLTVRAECTRDAADAVDTTVVVVQPSPTTAVLPLLVSAHELTQREEAVLAELVRGATTDEVARALHISPHTVRDHVKSLFDKVGVRSRGELVSRLYGLHLAPGLSVDHTGA